LYLLVQPTGAKSFAVRYSRAGRVMKLTLGPYPALSLVDARRRALGIAASVANGADPAEERKAARQRGKQRLAFRRRSRRSGRSPKRPENSTFRRSNKGERTSPAEALIAAGLKVQWHVWTAPAGQDVFGVSAPVGCSHVSGLFARHL
jgi:hypothetical protein